MWARPGGDAGFILLEVVVAFIIAALALASLFSIASAGLRSVHAAGAYEDALSRARSHLAALGKGAPLLPGEQQGDDGGGYHWDMRIARIATAQAPPTGPAAGPLASPTSASTGLVAGVGNAPSVSLYAVAVGIAWREDGRAREVWLRSKRIGPAPPRAP